MYKPTLHSHTHCQAVQIQATFQVPAKKIFDNKNAKVNRLASERKAMQILLPDIGPMHEGVVNRVGYHTSFFVKQGQPCIPEYTAMSFAKSNGVTFGNRF